MDRLLLPVALSCFGTALDSLEGVELGGADRQERRDAGAVALLTLLGLTRLRGRAHP